MVATFARLARAGLRVAVTAAACGAAQGADLSPGLTIAEALRLALGQNPGILLQQRQIDVAEGAVLQARGFFDPEVVVRSQRNRDVRPLRADETATLNALGVPGVSQEVTPLTAYGVGV